MGGLTSAVDWWEEWQLRVLVLTSLAIQFLLVIYPLLRRRAIPGWVRFTLWLAYLAGDAVSIYALATLFNRHKTDQDNGGRSSRMLLEVVWAPVLLLHLGGQDGISAYNIEDNELWSRHLLTAVSQVTVAVYVFYKTWPPGGGDKRLLLAAIVLFVPGVLKCFHKPWALKSASIYSLVSSSAAVIQKEGEMMYPPLALEEYVKGAKNLLVREQTEEGEAQAARASSSMEDEGRRRPRRNVMEMEPAAGTGTARGIASTERRQRIREMLQGHNETSKLFVDLSSSYSRRLRILQEFWRGEGAYGSVRQGLATAFLLLYTKLKTVDIHDFDEKSGIRTQVKSLFNTPIHWSRVVLPLAAIGLFHHSHREAYNDIDVKITYVLLCCTAALEYSSTAYYFTLFSLIELSRQYSLIGYFVHGEAGELQWPEMVSQYSFIGYFARDIKHSKMMWIVSLLGCKDFLDQHWCMKSCFSSARISELVLRYLKDGWREKIEDAASYRRFNNHRSSEGLSLSLSIKREKQPLLFDDSVLLWHIATDFCFFSSSSSSSDDHPEVPPTNGGRNNRKAAVLCRQMSNYMVYLLLVNPEMLLPGSRRYLFTAARQELEAIFKDEKPPFEETELTGKINSKLKLGSSSQAEAGPENIIQEAWMLAQKLQSLGDEKKMWKVIQDVWVEMLCFSASRCRGYLHAKALGKGGEFLSYVWLLLFHMGMETFTDKLQREEEEAGNNAAAITAPSTSERVSSTTTGAGAPSTSSDVHTASAGAAAAPSTSEICIWPCMV